jgi:hypothetical protein
MAEPQWEYLELTFEELQTSYAYYYNGMRQGEVLLCDKDHVFKSLGNQEWELIKKEKEDKAFHFKRKKKVW